MIENLSFLQDYSVLPNLRQQIHSGLITKNKNIQYPVFEFTFLWVDPQKSSEYPLHYIGRYYHLYNVIYDYILVACS